MIRSILAVMSGYLLYAVMKMMLLGLTGAGLPVSFHTADSPGFPAGRDMLFFPVIILSAVAGGYVTAALARIRLRQHVFALAGVMLILGVVNILSHLNQQPPGFLSLQLAAGIAGILAGGWWKERRVRERRAAANAKSGGR